MGAYGDNSVWANTVLVPGGGNSAVALGGAIFRGSESGQIYYQGADGALQAAYWDGSTWQHGWLSDPFNPAQHVLGDIVSNEAGGNIFYFGADGNIYHCYYDGGWINVTIPLWGGARMASDSNLSMNADGTKVAYKSADGTLSIIYKVAVGWSYYHSPLDFVDGTIRMNHAGDVVFYRGLDGKLRQHYFLGTSWHTRVVIANGTEQLVDNTFDIKPDCTYNDAQIYFRGADSHVYVAFSPDGNFPWVAGTVICPGLLNDSQKCLEGSHIRYSLGVVAYCAASGYFEAYCYGYYGNITFANRHLDSAGNLII